MTGPAGMQDGTRERRDALHSYLVDLGRGATLRQLVRHHHAGLYAGMAAPSAVCRRDLQFLEDLGLIERRKLGKGLAWLAK